MTKNLIIVGAGGAGLEALLVARRMGGWTIAGFADDNAALAGTTLEGVPVLGAVTVVTESADREVTWFHCGLGSNALRKAKAEILEAAGFKAATLIDPSVIVADSAKIGAGCYLAPYVFVGPLAVLHRHVLVNVGASLGHHCEIGDYAQVCPGARVSGRVRLGAGSFLGSNAVVAPNTGLGDQAVLGAASFTAKSIPAGATAVGNPARVIYRTD